MKKYLIIAVCLLTLVSCDVTLYKANPGDTTLSQVETLNQDSTCYKIIVDQDRINIYTADNKLLYKNCRSEYNNQLMYIPIGALILTVLIVFALGILLGFQTD